MLANYKFNQIFNEISTKAKTKETPVEEHGRSRNYYFYQSDLLFSLEFLSGSTNCTEFWPLALQKL